MKKRLPVKLIVSVGLIVYICLLFAIAATLYMTTKERAAGWGDNGGGRPSYTSEEVNEGNVLGSKIVFNSITDSVDGDEKNFVSAKLATDDPQGVWQGNRIIVEDGEEYTIRVYIHNDNPNTWDAVAEDTMVAISVPQDSGTELTVWGLIHSSNADPGEYWDSVVLESEGEAFRLEYLYGSAVYYNDGFGVGGYSLGDDIVTKATGGGQIIGYEALDGRIPGGYQYDAYITITVRAVFEPGFTVSPQVRLAGTKEWGSSVNTKIGDEVEIQIEYKNMSTVGLTQSNVMLKSILPENLCYVPGSTRLWNSNNSGAIINPDKAIFQSGINIGSYEPKANAFIRFSAIVVDDSLQKDANTLVNWTLCGVGRTTIYDRVSVIVQK